MELLLKQSREGRLRTLINDFIQHFIGTTTTTSLFERFISHDDHVMKDDATFDIATMSSQSQKRKADFNIWTP